MIPNLLLAIFNQQIPSVSLYKTGHISNPDPYEVARVRGFILAAHLGLRDLPGDDVPVLADKPDGVGEDDQPTYAHHDYSWNGIDVTVDAQYGLVVAYIDDANEDKLRNRQPPYDRLDDIAPRRVSDAQAAALALRFHRATDSPYGITVHSVRDHVGRSIGANLGIDFCATVGGVPYDREFGGYLEIGRDDGRLHWYQLRSLGIPFPRPPVILAPRVSAADARLTALRAVARRANVPLAESSGWTFALCIASLDTRSGYGVSSFLTPDEAARARAGEGRLVYAGQFVGGDPKDDNVPRLYATVDALDGRLLSIRSNLYGRGGGGGAKVPPPPLAVPADARPWRVGVGKEPWTASATAALVPASGNVPEGAKLTLTDGHAAFPAAYDPKTNLLAISGKTYRPGPALAALLRRRAKA